MSLTPQHNKHPRRKLNVCIFKEKLGAGKKGTTNTRTHDAAGGLSATVCGISPHVRTITVPPGPCLRALMMDGRMDVPCRVFHRNFPWGCLSVGRAQPPERWYLLQTRQLTDSSSLCIFPQRRTVLICFLYGIFYYNPYMTCRFPVLHPEPEENV